VPHDPARRRRLARIGTILAVLLLALIVSFPFLSGFVAPFVPDRVQQPVGEHMVQSTAQQGQFCRDPEGIAALQKLVDRLAVAAGDDRTYRVYVSNADVLNAYAAPGGHIVLFRAIIDHADTPEEVAGVLAHEMGHVVEDHPAKGLVEAVGYGIFGLLLPGGSADTAVIARSLLTNHYSRGDELEADRVGVEMLNDASVDSRGLIAFFEHMKSEGNEIPGALEFLSTHPSGDTRADQLEDLIREGEPAMSAEEWAALRGVCSTTAASPEPIVVRH
jgi:beta-barrel assembly-enhancing protease